MTAREMKREPLPALLLAPLFSRSLTLVPRSFRLNRTETLATQAILAPIPHGPPQLGRKRTKKNVTAYSVVVHVLKRIFLRPDTLFRKASQALDC